MGKLEVFFAVLFFSFMIAGAYWVIIKKIATVGVWLIPVAMSFIAAWVAVGDESKFQGLINIALTIGFISLGVVGSLMCYLYADLYKLEKGAKSIQKDVNQIKTSENKDLGDILDITDK